MRKVLKKSLSVAIAAIMILTSLSAPALAEETDSQPVAAVSEQAAGNEETQQTLTDDNQDNTAAESAAMQPETSSGGQDVQPAESGEDAQQDADGSNPDAQPAESAEVQPQTGSDEQETIESPAFEGEQVVDGVTITVSAAENIFPADARLVVENVMADQEQQAADAVESERPEDYKVASSYSFDIKVVDANGEEIQPKPGEEVRLSFAHEAVSNENLNTQVYHVTEDAAANAFSADSLDVSEELVSGTGAQSAAVVWSEGFSIYVIEFTYEKMQYVLEGDSSVALSEILETVGLAGEPSAVEVNNEELFSASDETGEWIVTAHQAFDTDEWMKVTIDGVVFEIKVTDAAGDEITYLDKNGETKTVLATKLSDGKLTKEWYYVSGAKWIDNVWVPADAQSVVNIILCDGANLGTHGISINDGKTLRIWAQSTVKLRSESGKDKDYDMYNDTNVHTGRLHTTKYGIRVHANQTVEINGGIILADTDEDGQAGIGGKDGRSAGNIIINGGDVRAYGTINAAGIGGGNGGSGGNITINGGNVRAKSDDEDGAGIGGGEGKGGGNITITGGDIVAYGSESAAGIGAGYDANDGLNNTIITITGGKIYAKGGDRGAGIGCGEKGSRYAAQITISGGDIEAVGGDHAAGIGGGDESGAGEIYITGTWENNAYTTKVLAKGGSDGAGIGSGDNSDNGYGNENKVIISGGYVKAEGGERGAGIGGGEDSPHGGIVEINGSWTGNFDSDNKPIYTTYVSAKGGERGAGIGGGDEGGGGIGRDGKTEGITINGGKVEAKGGEYAAGIGSGDNSDSKHSGGVINITGQIVGMDSSKKLPVYSTFVTAEGGEDGAGIGGGDYSESGNITITGACVEAKGVRRGAGIGGSCNAKANTITIQNNAFVQATGDYGAGIGTGAGELMKNYGAFQGSEFPTRIVGGTINIKNANVIAVSVLGGAGIGGGIFGRADTINISGGQVAAQGGVTVGPGSVPWLYITQMAGAAIAEMGGNLAGQIAETSAGSGSPVGENVGNLFTAIGQALSKVWNWFVNLFADEPDMIFYTGAGIGGGFCATGGTINISDNAVVQATAGILPPDWCLKAQVDASGADVDYHNPDRNHPAYAIGAGGDVKDTTVINNVQSLSITNYTNANGNNVALVVTVPVELDAKLEGNEFKYTPIQGDKIMLPAFMPNPAGEGLVYPGIASAQAYPVAVIRPMPVMYGVVYQPNGSEEDPVNGTMETQTVMEETAFSLNENKFTREGYTFMGWNTAPDGSGTSYADKAEFTKITANLVLYAQWEKSPKITYYENDKTTLIARKEVEYGSTVELMPLSWFNGGGDYYAYWNYLDGENVDQRVEVTTLENVTQDVTLYLDSNAPLSDTVSITYLPNGGKGKEQVDQTSTGRNPKLDNFIGRYDNYTIKAQGTDEDEEVDFLLDGYYVESWKSQETFEGYKDLYAIGEKPYEDKNPEQLRNLTLLAQWAPIQYTVKFDMNLEKPGDASQYSGTMEPQTMTYDVEATLSPNTFTRTGYNFAGWSKNENGSGVRYRDEQSLKNLTTKKDGTVTLYAVWEKKKLTVTFMGNGGELPEMTEEDISNDCYTQTGIVYDELTKLTANRFAREGYEFNGWINNQGGAIPLRPDDGSCWIKETHSVALYARWKPIEYKVAFNKNAPEELTVEGTMEQQDMTYDVETKLTPNTYTCEGYTFTGWNTKADGSGTTYQNEKTVKNLTTEKYQFLPQKGVVTLYAQWQKVEADENIIGVTGSFNDKIKLNYYFSFSDKLLSDNDAYVLLSNRNTGKTVRLLVREAENVPGRGYKFSIPLVAKEASDTIVAQVFDGSGTQVTIKGTKQDYTDVEYTLMQYLNWLAENGQDAEEKAVGAAAKDYCSAAQIYFNYNTDGVTVSNAVVNVTADTLSTYVAGRSGTLPTGVSIKGITAMLESDNTLRLYLGFKDVEPSNLTFQIDDETVDIKQRSDGAYYLALDTGVYSNHLQDSHIYSVSDGTNTYKITASVLTYARACANKAVEAESNLGKALYLYNQASVACFGDDE